jgi:aryl-alcohol dehydrogenase-like predicted oxidoreductase
VPAEVHSIASAGMEQRHLGRSGLRVSRLALGTMTWGRDTDEHEAEDQLRVFVEAGGTLVDTAATYGDGTSEGVLGELLADVIPRGDLVIATKAGAASGNGGADTSRRALLATLDASLDRLGTDYVDLWQVSVWSDATPIDEVLATLDYAVLSGRARYVGVSNFAGWQTAWSAAWQLAWPGRVPLVSTQVEYSLVQRDAERDVVPAAGVAGMGLLAWSPLGRGVLTGKYRSGIPADSRLATPHFEDFVRAHLDERSRRITDAVVTAADGLGVAPVEIALAWVRDQPGVVAAIVGARTAGQLLGSLRAEELTLPREIRSALDDVSSDAEILLEPLPTP